MNITDLTPYAISQAQNTQQNWLAAQNMLWNALANNAKMAREADESDLQKMIWANQYANQLKQNQDLYRLQDLQNAANTSLIANQLSNENIERTLRNKLLQNQIEENERKKNLEPLNAMLQLFGVINQYNLDKNTLNNILKLFPSDLQQKYSGIINNINLTNKPLGLKDLQSFSANAGRFPYHWFDQNIEQFQPELSTILSSEYQKLENAVNNLADKNNTINSLNSDILRLQNYDPQKVNKTTIPEISNILNNYKVYPKFRDLIGKLNTDEASLVPTLAVAELKSMRDNLDNQYKQILGSNKDLINYLGIDNKTGLVYPNLPESWKSKWGIKKPNANTTNNINPSAQSVIQSTSQSSGSSSTSVPEYIKNLGNQNQNKINELAIDTINTMPEEKRTIEINKPLATSEGVSEAMSKIKQYFKNYLKLDSIPPHVKLIIKDNTGRAHIIETSSNNLADLKDSNKLLNAIEKKLIDFGNIARNNNLKDYKVVEGINNVKQYINSSTPDNILKNWQGAVLPVYQPSGMGYVNNMQLGYNYVDIDKLLNDYYYQSKTNPAPIASSIATNGIPSKTLITPVYPIKYN